MKVALLEHTEAKIINFLRDAKAPNHASQIALHIHETREETLQAIQRLVKSSTVKGIQDFAFLNSTGETIAYILPNTSPPPASFPPSVPSRNAGRLTPPAPRG
jgi:hypothetical protein